MRPAARCTFWALACALLASRAAGAEGWTLSAAELPRLAQGEILTFTDVEGEHGRFRAAVQIAAPVERVFRTMTDCGEALEYVPHLQRCAVLESGPAGTWQVIEHEVDYGWLLPRAHYVFRAEYEPHAAVRFSNVRGDFRENDGVWELRSAAGGAGTLVTYEARVVPRRLVPRWLVRSTLRRELPALLEALRARCEAEPPETASPVLPVSAPRRDPAR